MRRFLEESIIKSEIYKLLLEKKEIISNLLLKIESHFGILNDKNLDELRVDHVSVLSYFNV
jgi:hypothetical protein